VDPSGIVRTSGAEVGAELILTKPLGTGILSTAIKQGIAPDASVAEAVATMTALNKSAAEAMLEIGVLAATDVTGFGLIGHLLEMLDENLGADLDAGAVPMLPDAIELAGRGVYPGGSERNLRAGTSLADGSAVDENVAKVLFDAQTSGGLLIAVRPEKAEALLEGLRSRGVSGARIGKIVEATGGVKVVVR
jgi:selenide, water dikinase